MQQNMQKYTNMAQKLAAEITIKYPCEHYTAAQADAIKAAVNQLVMVVISDLAAAGQSKAAGKNYADPQAATCADWERLNSCTTRLAVFGGWLVLYESGARHSMIFIADPEHKWAIKP